LIASVSPVGNLIVAGAAPSPEGRASTGEPSAANTSTAECSTVVGRGACRAPGQGAAGLRSGTAVCCQGVHRFVTAGSQPPWSPGSRAGDRVRGDCPLSGCGSVGDLSGVIFEQDHRGSDRSGQCRRDERQGDDAVCGDVLDSGGRFVDESEKVRVLATAPCSWLRPC